MTKIVRLVSRLLILISSVYCGQYIYSLKKGHEFENWQQLFMVGLCCRSFHCVFTFVLAKSTMTKRYYNKEIWILFFFLSQIQMISLYSILCGIIHYFILLYILISSSGVPRKFVYENVGKERKNMWVKKKRQRCRE